MPECQSCHQPIEWAYTEAGRRIPLDIDAKRRKVMVEVARHSDGSMIVGHVDQYVSHFATCPEARHHRRPQKRAEASPEPML
jgi:hypothetical protein